MHLLVFKLIVFLALTAEIVTFCLLPLITAKRLSESTRNRIIGIANAFSGGIFLCGGFVHLLGESTEALEHLFDDQPLPYALICSAGGFLLTFLVEKVLFSHHHHSHGEEAEDSSLVKNAEGGTPTSYGTTTPGPTEHDSHESHPHGAEKTSFVSYLLVLVLSIHSFIAGLALGLNPSIQGAMPLFVAILSHKWVEAFAVGVSIIRNKLSTRRFIILIALYALASASGIWIGVIVTVSSGTGETTAMIEAFGTAIASGTFIYVASVDVLSEEFKNSKDRFIKAISCLVGFGLLLGLLFAFPHTHDEEDNAHMPTDLIVI